MRTRRELWSLLGTTGDDLEKQIQVRGRVVERRKARALVRYNQTPEILQTKYDLIDIEAQLEDYCIVACALLPDPFRIESRKYWLEMYEKEAKLLVLLGKEKENGKKIRLSV